MREHKYRCWYNSDYAEDGNTPINFVMSLPFSFSDIEDGAIHTPKDYIPLNLGIIKIMEYIGAKDDSGKDVCEGDIVSYHETEMEDGHIIQEYDVHSVVFWSEDTYQWMIRDLYSGDEWELWDSNWTNVIGNIWENEKLLPENKEKNNG